MKSLLLAALAGVACLPATYRISRDGYFLGTFVVLIVIGALGGVFASLVSKVKAKSHVLLVGSAFVIGALISQSIGFARHYFETGYRDRYLSVGVVFAVAEFVAIAVIGGLATCVASAVRNPFTTRSG